MKKWNYIWFLLIGIFIFKLLVFFINIQGKLTEISPRGFDFTYEEEIFRADYISYSTFRNTKTTSVVVYDKSLKKIPHVHLWEDDNSEGFYISYKGEIYARNNDGIFLITKDFKEPLKIASLSEYNDLLFKETEFINFLKKLLIERKQE